MLSYRHAFHAGNHADVLKHLTEVLTLDHLLQKQDKPLCYIDTHSGPGMYALLQGYAQQNTEYETGISKLWQQRSLPEPLARYVEVVAAHNPGGSLKCYPGSPAIAKHLLKSDDRLQLFELHPKDFELLQDWAKGNRRIRVQRENGFERLTAILPPPERRALVLIDPPYEVKQDYQLAITALQRALKRFPTGVYLLWYPLLARPEIQTMERKLKQLAGRYLHASLQVQDASSGGMFGSAVFVINPPWRLNEQLGQCLPFLLQQLGQDSAAKISLNSHGLD
ncbi:23S rRNA (adenine(2030)-N(6))-methyltransferase RlmJ [Endozoicomonas sp. SM1973]|uniref:Ribosomal RNA large subunit methyltransferase J n=1 Tax=Spartinivicinus marinus TaxID=2994442 RepID=A0A853I2C5_9GAMM|nr:23S rRNA (adenine(2030)-N(6))-methyltransferase RlmJ [Spartinivicinus marinus]MCX4025915.1 23S rRNA (adenine(2030)-N(6))-methyltransferase RlmJ [Spartinivicinus marinus]NYZ68100.1 23S rRNA (adenine(2030)-N(6))-methyltransferase RlmJ [Spartinivicinus marinus]